MLDDVHGGHGQAGAVDQASDVALELDVIEIELAGLDFQRGFLPQVAHGQQLRVPVEGAVIHAELGIHGDERFAALRVPHPAQRVDLEEAGVALPPGLIDAAQEPGGRAHEVAAQAQGGGELAGLVGHEAHRGVDKFLDNLPRGARRHFLDVHAAFGAGHDHRARHRPVQQHGQVIFLLDGRGAVHEQAVDAPALGAGLAGHQHIAEHGAGLLINGLGVRAEVDAALEAVLEGAFAPSARVDLGLDDHPRVARGEERFGDGFGLVGRQAGFPARDGHALLGQELLGLEFVQVHARWSMGT